jgi:hypothetical protein
MTPSLLELAHRQAERQKQEAIEAKAKLEAYAKSLPHVQTSHASLFGGKEMKVTVDLNWKKHPHSAKRYLEALAKG